MSKSITFIGKSGSRYKKGNIYGADIAESEFIYNLIKYSKFDKVSFANFRGYYNDIVVNRLKRTQNKKIINPVNKFSVLNHSETHRTDIIHDTYGDFLKAISFRDLYTSNKPPVTYIMHCTSAPEYVYTNYLFKCLLKFQKYDSLICTSNAMKTVVQKYLARIEQLFNEVYATKIQYNGRIDVIPLGVDVKKYKPTDKYESRKILNIPLDAFVILYHGRINFYFKSDLLPLLTVVKRLIKKNPSKKIILMISGQDSGNLPFYPIIKKEIENLNLEANTILLQTDINDTFMLYSAADVFTSPVDNVQETFGLTVVEAMSCGTPQIVSDWDGYKETVLDGKTGFLVPTYRTDCSSDISENPFADGAAELGHINFYSHFLLSQSTALDLDKYQWAFQQLLNNPNIISSMSEHSMNRAKEVYDWGKIIKRYDGLWEELINIRNSTDYQENETLKFFDNNYDFAFSNYPTYMLNGQSLFEITEEGKEFITKGLDFTLHFDNEFFFEEINLAKRILTFVYYKLNIGFEEIIDSFIDEKAENVIKRATMYLIKHGYLRLSKLKV